MAEEQHYTIDQVADLLRVSRWSVTRYIRFGELDAVKAPGRNGAVRIPESALVAWLDRHTVTVTTSKEGR